jgi:recombinational DNA repair protein (RecF pathway)
METCSVCKKDFELSELYEYRGAVACSPCFDTAIKRRDQERQEIIAENKNKTESFRGLDLSDSAIGKANRQILKKDIEIASKESQRVKRYESR